MTFTLQEVIEATGGRAMNADKSRVGFFDGVCTDSRKIRPGCLFVALRGPRHDGHDHAAQAVSEGAAGILVEEGRAQAGVPAVEVVDTLVALGLLARHVRRRQSFAVIAITGSVGKTTTKEMAASMLRAAGRRVLQTPGNLNNRIGLPLSILGGRGDEDAAVLELGISEPGEMAQLAAICEPDIAVVTAVAHAHTEKLGGLEGVAREKMAVATGLASGGTLVLPYGDPLLKPPDGVRVSTFGWHSGADVKGENLEFNRTLGSRFTVDGQCFDLSLHGRHNAENALAAVAAVRALGVSAREAAQGLSQLCPSPLRGEVRQAVAGCHVLVDCYNANPRAMEAALETLDHLASGARKLAVLGEMKELGEHSEEAHALVGRAAVDHGVDELYLLGSDTRWIRDAAIRAGLDPGRVRWYWDKETLSVDLSGDLQPGDWVLIKGSRAVGLEGVADSICRSEPFCSPEGRS